MKELNNLVGEMKNSPDGLTSRVKAAENRISELKDQMQIIPKIAEDVKIQKINEKIFKIFLGEINEELRYQKLWGSAKGKMRGKFIVL